MAETTRCENARKSLILHVTGFDEAQVERVLI